MNFLKRLFHRSGHTLATQAPPLEEVSYTMAYSVLPRYAYPDTSRLCALPAAATPKAIGPFFYILACQLLTTEPVPEKAALFQVTRGSLEAGGEYFLFHYPATSPVDFSHVDPEDILEGRVNAILAPYYSVILSGMPSQPVAYYVLGQAPIGGGTTLRFISVDGANANLGPGPSAGPAQFIAAAVAHASAA